MTKEWTCAICAEKWPAYTASEALNKRTRASKIHPLDCRQMTELARHEKIEQIIMMLLDRQSMEFKRDVQNYLDAEMMFEEYREEKERGGNDV